MGRAKAHSADLRSADPGTATECRWSGCGDHRTVRARKRILIASPMPLTLTLRSTLPRRPSQTVACGTWCPPVGRLSSLIATRLQIIANDGMRVKRFSARTPKECAAAPSGGIVPRPAYGCARHAMRPMPIGVFAVPDRRYTEARALLIVWPNSAMASRRGGNSYDAKRPTFHIQCGVCGKALRLPQM